MGLPAPYQKMLIKKGCGDFPGGPVVKTPAPNAGGQGSIPGRGTRPHMHAATKDPACRNKDPEQPK